MYDNIVHFPVFVYGATVTALGIAHKLRDKAVVVEKTGFFGREFTDCYNPGDSLREIEFSKDTEDLRAELTRRNILVDNKMHIQAVAPVLFNQMKEENLNFLFMTEVVNIKAAESGYEITLYNNSGFRKLHVKTIIDTTSLCETSPSNVVDIKSKSINATLKPVDAIKGFPGSDNPLVEFIQGRFDDEVYLKYQLEIDDDWIIAREKLYKFWISRKEELMDWNIAAVASSFDIKLDTKQTEIEKGWFWKPSCSNCNVLESYEAGIFLSEEMGL